MFYFMAASVTAWYPLGQDPDSFVALFVILEPPTSPISGLIPALGLETHRLAPVIRG